MEFVFLEGFWVADPEEIMTTWGSALRCILQLQGFYGPVELAVMVWDTTDPQVARIKKGGRAFIRGFINEEDGEVWVEARGIFITWPEKA
ncbi:MAG: hypothetical protein IMW96_11425 [Thermoanaerobacteraceae bacterium]|nr:hypothetical protein [Thermoanaerobacteraceae bacterium]